MASELTFRLDVEDDWPPVACECLVCTDDPRGYRVDVPPFFIKGLSVGDIIAVDRNASGEVVAWSHVVRSQRSTVWLMVYGSYSVEDAIGCLKSLECNIERLRQLQYFAIDVPETCSLKNLDACLARLDPGQTAVAFPAFRLG